MAAPDDSPTATPSEIPDDFATLRVAPPASGEIPDDLATMLVAKPAGAQTLARQDTHALTGANPAAPVPFIFGKRIAQGGMGAILEASDCKLGRTIAAKVMLSEANCSEDQKQRFVQEAAILGRLEHPNIVPIHDLGLDSQGQLYYTMKLVKGRTLQDILDELRREHPDDLQHYTLDRLLLIFRKVCDALAFAHAQNIIHRDLKPENIMVGEFGEVLVMDWGIAKILGELGSSDGNVTGSDGILPSSMTSSHRSLDGTASLSATMDGAVMGTPNYMSPEQAMGKVNELDQRSDIFSLGGILYAILTLRPPVEGKDVWEVLAKVQAANITAPTMFGATTTGKGEPKAKGEVLEAKQIKPLPHMPGGKVPAALSSVAMKALTLDKAGRYQDVAAFSADIEAFQGGFATTAEQAGLATQLVLLIKRNRGIFTTAAAAWLLITALAVWFVLNLQAKEKRAIAGEAAAKESEAAAKQSAAAARAAETVAENKAEAARRALAHSQIALAEAAYRDHDGQQMLAALGQVPDDLRDTNWHYLQEHADDSIGTIRSGNDSESTDAVAHPQKPGVFALVKRQGRVAFVDAGTGDEQLNFEAGFSAGTTGHCIFAISPDGSRLVIGRTSGDGLVVHSTQDGRKLAEWEAPHTHTLEFSKDGAKVLQVSLFANNITLFDAASGVPAWTFKSTGVSSQTRAIFSPDGGLVYAWFNKEGNMRFSAKDGTVLPAPRFSGSNGLAISPDGRRLLAADEGEVSCSESGVDGRLLFRFRPETLRLTDMTYTPDGSRILTLANLPGGRQSIKVWEAHSGALLQTLMGGQSRAYRLVVHPLSGELLVPGQTTRAWRLPTSQEKWSFRESAAGLNGAFWGQDDRVLTDRTGMGTALLDLERPDPRQQPIWEPGRRFKYAISVSTDGQLAALAELPAQSGRLALNTNRSVKVFRLTGDKVEEVHAFKVARNLRQLNLSPDGSLLYVAERQLLNSANGEQVARMNLPEVNATNAVAWLSNTRILTALTTVHSRGVEGSQEQLVVWDTAGKPLRSRDCPTPVNCLAARPGDSWFAEAGTDNMVRVRNADTLEVQREFRAHDGPIAAMVLHPTRPILATASDDQTVKLWDLETGRCLEEYFSPVGKINRLDISPGGKRLGCWADKLTRIWEPECLK